MTKATKKPDCSTPLLEESKEDEVAAQNRKKKSSLLPIMVFAVISFTLVLIVTSFRDGVFSKLDALTLAVGPLLQALWAAWVVKVGREGFFTRETILRSFPIMWIPAIPAIMLLGVFALRWEQVMAMVDNFPIQTFVSLQALRVLAVGSLIKWYMGIFPTAFAWFTAFPDMLFGISAVGLLIQNDWMHEPSFLFWWNFVGFVIIVPGAVLVLQSGMAPTEFYKSKVSTVIPFEYPMVLGPSLVVPTLGSWNYILAAWASGKLASGETSFDAEL